MGLPHKMPLTARLLQLQAIANKLLFGYKLDDAIQASILYADQSNSIKVERHFDQVRHLTHFHCLSGMGEQCWGGGGRLGRGTLNQKLSTAYPLVVFTLCNSVLGYKVKLFFNKKKPQQNDTSDGSCAGQGEHDEGTNVM